MKLNENDIRTLNRLMETERQLREIMIGNEGDYDNTHDPVTIYGIIHDMADLLYEGAEIIKEAGDLVQHYEENDWEVDEDEEDSDDDDLSFMVMIAEPGEEFAVLTEDEAIEMYPELFPRGDSSKELIPVPNIPDVYYTVPSQSRMTLTPCENTSGECYFDLSGESPARMPDTIFASNALYEAGIPFEINGLDKIFARIEGKDYIPVVPIYESTFFGDCIHLPKGDAEALVAKETIWEFDEYKLKNSID